MTMLEDRCVNMSSVALQMFLNEQRNW